LKLGEERNRSGRRGGGYPHAMEENRVQEKKSKPGRKKNRIGKRRHAHVMGQYKIHEMGLYTALEKGGKNCLRGMGKGAAVRKKLQNKDSIGGESWSEKSKRTKRVQK